jgi:hypothetical protein
VAGETAWTMPRTPDGQPDLQGTWVNYDATPFQAPDAAGAATTSGAGAADNRVELEPVTQPGDVFFNANVGSGTNVSISPRRSLVVDPPSGIVPVMPWALQKAAYDFAHVHESWEHLPAQTRCIAQGAGRMFPGPVDRGYEIVQAPGVVMIVYEIMNTARIIPVDGSPHLPPNVRLWDGDSRGRWEGDTLVVDVTNFNAQGSMYTGTRDHRTVPQSEGLHLVERFRRVSADTINYAITIEAPAVFARAWTLAGPLIRDDTYRMFEYACHENNQSVMEAVLSAGP